MKTVAQYSCIFFLDEFMHKLRNNPGLKYFTQTLDTVTSDFFSVYKLSRIKYEIKISKV